VLYQPKTAVREGRVMSIYLPADTVCEQMVHFTALPHFSYRKRRR